MCIHIHIHPYTYTYICMYIGAPAPLQDAPRAEELVLVRPPLGARDPRLLARLAVRPHLCGLHQGLLGLWVVQDQHHHLRGSRSAEDPGKNMKRL